MNKTEKKKIYVVSVINESKVGINCGSQDGISNGDTILFYALGEEIIDPETQESLGRIEIVKGKGRVTHVQPKLATVESIRLKRKVSRANSSVAWHLALTQLGDTMREEDPIPYDDIRIGDMGKLI